MRKVIRVLARPWLAVLAVVVAPFVPGALQFIRLGVPDLLFTGDSGVLELDTLHAAHGSQMVGPYSHFLWSHPGPAFFYLALPVYAAFHQHGSALNLFALIVSFVAALSLVVIARRLAGDLYAFATAGLLAVYELVAVPFPLSVEWNPVVPVLPLALLSFLGVRLARGSTGALPAFVFVASAIVQTHLGFAPAVAFLVVIAIPFCLRELRSGPPLGRRERTSALRSLALAVALLVLLWVLPIYQNATGHPGNLRSLWVFFASHHSAEHPWRLVADVVAGQLAVFPLAVVRLLNKSAGSDPGVALRYTLALAQLGGLTTALVLAIRRRDPTAALLSGVALGLILVALAAVRAIRGEINDYLVVWISVLGFIAHAALAASLIPAAVRRLGERRVRIGLIAVILPVLLLSLETGGGRAMVRDRDVAFERLASEVEAFVRRTPVDRPMIRFASLDQWGQAVGLVVALHKHRIALVAPDDWLFMVGPQFKADSVDHPVLLVANRELADSVRGRRDYQLVSSADGTFVFLHDPTYLGRHRIVGSPGLISAVGTAPVAERAVDGVTPEEGLKWDSPMSVVLDSTASTIEVAVPSGPLEGVVLSVDGNDIYDVHCVRPDGSSFLAGTTSGDYGRGMRTRLVFAEALDRCRSVRVSPERGDGFYSVGEISFVLGAPRGGTAGR